MYQFISIANSSSLVLKTTSKQKLLYGF